VGTRILNFPETTGYLFEFPNRVVSCDTIYHVKKKYYSKALVNIATRVVDLERKVFIKDKVKDLRVHQFIGSVKTYSPFTKESLKDLGLSTAVQLIQDVFFDMDGTLFDYDRQILNICGEPLSSLTKEQKHSVTSNLGFFSTMPLYEGVDELFNLLKQANVNVHILSATGERDPVRIAKEKAQALHDKLAHWKFRSVVFVNRSSDKAFYASPTRLLVDDREKAYLPFEQAGGHIIKHIDVKTTHDHLLQLW